MCPTWSHSPRGYSELFALHHNNVTRKVQHSKLVQIETMYVPHNPLAFAIPSLGIKL